MNRAGRWNLVASGAWAGLIAAFIGAGCQTPGGAGTAGPVNGAKPVDGTQALNAATSTAASREELELIQSQVMDFADDFSLRLADLTDRVEARRPNMETRIAIHRLRYTMAHGLTIIASSANPKVNLIDTVVVMSLQARLVEERMVPEYFEDMPWIANIFKSGAEQIRTVAARTLTEEQLAEIDGLVDQWVEGNTYRHYAAYIRLEDFAERRQNDTQATGAKPRGASSIFGLLFIDPLAGLDPTTRELEQTRLFAERAMFYVQRMPQLISWQAELLYIDAVAEPEVEQVLADVTMLSASIDRVTSDVTALRQDIPRIIAAEREAAIDQALTGFFDELGKERAATLDDLGARSAEIEGTLAELSRAFQSGEQFGNSATELVKSVQDLTATLQDMRADDAEPATDAPPQDPTTIADYERLLVTAGEVTDKLDALVASVDSLASSDAWDERRATVDQVAADSQARLETVIDRAYKRGMFLIGALLIGSLLVGLVLKLVPPRARA